MRALTPPACHEREKLRLLRGDFGKNVVEFLRDSAFFVLWTGDYEGPTRETELWTSR